MATIVREDVTPTLIPNTTMTRMLVDGAPKSYQITPIDGYILHDKARDWYDTDPETGLDYPEPTRGYTVGMASCALGYNFDTTVTIDGYTAYGSREFFARPASEVPADQIFGVPTDTEIA